MTVTSTLITDAFRESNLVGLGETPEAAAGEEAARLLNRIVASVFGNEVGEGLADWPIGSTAPYSGWGPEQWDYLEGDIRIIVTDGATHSLNLPPYPQDGDRLQLIDAGSDFATYPVTLVRQASKFNGAATDYVADTDGFNTTWFYRADLADWKQVLPLVTTDEFPFPERHDDAFIGMLATRLNPRYQQSLTEESRASLTRSISQLRSAYKRTQRVNSDLAVLRLTGSGSSGLGGGPATTQRFLNGNPY